LGRGYDGGWGLKRGWGLQDGSSREGEAKVVACLGECCVEVRWADCWVEGTMGRLALIMGCPGEG
jgi:hypothetical protein